MSDGPYRFRSAPTERPSMSGDWREVGVAMHAYVGGHTTGPGEIDYSVDADLSDMSVTAYGKERTEERGAGSTSAATCEEQEIWRDLRAELKERHR